MPSLGAPEIIIILVLALLVFGPKRLPEMGRSLGRTVREFKKASDTARKEFGVDEIEKEIKGVKSELKGVQKTVTDAKADLKIDVDAEAAKPDPGKTDGAADVGAGAAAVAAAVAPDTAAGSATDATQNDDEVLVGDVVDEGPAVETAPASADEAVLDAPIDVTRMTAAYEPPAVSADPSQAESVGARADDGEATTADAPPQGA